MNPEALDTPVLLITWIRPDTTRRVLDHLARVRPRTLIVASDGPRHAGDIPKIQETRGLFEDLAWDCEVTRLFSDFNMGLPWRVTSAIDSAFERVEQLIILEDDILANESFFSYARQMLDYYDSDERVMAIRGASSGLAERGEPLDSYIFTRFMSPWGWATWRRAWQGFDHSFFSSTKAGFFRRHPVLRRIRHSLAQIPYWPRIRHDKDLKDRLASCGERYTFWLEKCDRQLYTLSWAGLFAMWIMENDGLVVTPHVNMTHNIGFGTDAANTKPNMAIPRTHGLEPMSFPISHPSQVAVNTESQRIMAVHTDKVWRSGRRLLFKRF
jgi:hypothetical protein